MAQREKLQVRTSDGVIDCTQHRPSAPGAYPAVLFFMDAFGVREALWKMADRLADDGYHVLMPKVFYRAGAFAPFEPKTAFGDPAERERLMKLMNFQPPEAVMRDIGAQLEHLSKTKGVSQGGVGCVGYCMGGRLGVLAGESFP